jgi:hypothetical protein
MPAKTKSPRAPKALSIQQRFKAHLEASAQCEVWARKGIALAAAGRIAEAKAAEEKARRCMARMLALEPRYKDREGPT